MKVTSWWKYNPFLHKPRALEPLVPWGSFFYYGPDPSAGVSYGCYDEKSTGFTVVSTIAPQVYSPVTGEEMELITELNPEEAKKFFSKANSEQSSHADCSNCGTSCYSSINVVEAPKLHCFACGSEIHQTMEAKTMGKKEEVANKREKLEAQLQKVQALSPGESEDTTEFIGLEEIIQKINDDGGESLDESGDDMSMEMDAPAEEPAMEMEEEVSVEDDSSDMEMEMEEPSMDEAESCGPSMAMEEEHTDSDEAESEPAMAEEEGEIDLDAIVSKVKEKVEAARQAKASQTKRKEIRKSVLAKLKARQARAKLMTTKKEEAKVEEVAKEATATTIEAKRSKMKEILAAKRKEREAAKAEEVEATTEVEATETVEEVKAEEAATEETVEEVKAEEAVEATETVEEVKAEEAATEETVEEVKAEESTTEEVKAEEAVEATEGLVDENMEEHNSDKLDDNNDGSPELSAVKEADKKAANEGAEMHASTELRYETLAGLGSLDSLTENDIDMVLFGSDTVNPTWSIFAKNVPVARVQLKSQDNAEEIREVFASEDYALNLVKHCAQDGLVNVLEKVNAEFWANHVSDKEIADRYHAVADAKIKEEREAIVGSFEEDFFKSVNTVVVGFNKNFFKGEGNALKNALLQNLVVAGLPETAAASVIEKSFVEGSSAFFGQLFDKTVDFMNKSDDAKSEIAQAILDCNVLTPESNSIEAGARMEDRLDRATSLASLSSNMQVVDNRVQVDADDFKARLKKSWRK